MTELKIIQQGKPDRQAAGEGTRNHQRTWCHPTIRAQNCCRRIGRIGGNWEERWQLHGKALWLQRRLIQGRRIDNAEDQGLDSNNRGGIRKIGSGINLIFPLISILSNHILEQISLNKMQLNQSQSNPLEECIIVPCEKQNLLAHAKTIIQLQ